MTVGLSATPFKIEPQNGAVGVMIGNPTGSAGVIRVTQRGVVTGATEAAAPTTDPGLGIAVGSIVSLPLGQAVWIHVASGTQNCEVILTF